MPPYVQAQTCEAASDLWPADGQPRLCDTVVRSSTTDPESPRLQGIARLRTTAYYTIWRDGKEGVIGSSPIEGLAVVAGISHLLLLLVVGLVAARSEVARIVVEVR